MNSPTTPAHRLQFWRYCALLIAGQSLWALVLPLQLLTGQRGGSALGRGVEDRVQAVARRLDDAPGEAFNGGLQQRVVPGQRWIHGVRVLLP